MKVVAVQETEEEKRIRSAHAAKPPVGAMINLNDFEVNTRSFSPSYYTWLNIRLVWQDVAKSVLTDVAWGYYSSAAEEGSSFDNNLTSYSRYEFRPRWYVSIPSDICRALPRNRTTRNLYSSSLQKSGGADLATTFLGIPTSSPIFVSPCAASGLGHAEGEVSIARGAGKSGIIQVVSDFYFHRQMFMVSLVTIC